MTNEEILSHVDHTLLKATATWEDIQAICEDSIKFKTASVCIPQTYVKRIQETFGDKVNICTVVGFPLGYNSTNSKVTETLDAIADGANEIDMVINISDVKNGSYDKVLAEIKAIKKACGSHILKVIIETCYLTDEEKIEMCKVVTASGANYIKTSTGFGTRGASFEDVKIFKENIGPNVLIKAAGGIKTIEDLNKFLELGCDRLGTSRAINIIKGQESIGY